MNSLESNNREADENDVVRTVVLRCLASEDAFERESSIIQLSSYYHDNEVFELLVRAFQKETIPALKTRLQYLVNEFAFQKQTFSEEKPDSASFSVRWAKSTDAEKLILIAEFKLFTPQIQEELFCNLLAKDDSAENILPFLISRSSLLRNKNVYGKLVPLLQHIDSTLVYRVLFILFQFAPQHAIKQLPALLKHQDTNIRLLSLRLLHKVFPKEALRLLSELIFSYPKYKAVGFLSMLLFPFDEVYPVLLRLIEDGSELADGEQKILFYLVGNNPDASFLKRVALQYVLHGHELPLWEKLFDVAAQAIIRAGYNKESKSDLKQRIVTAIKDSISESVAEGSNTELDSTKDPCTAEEAPEGCKKSPENDLEIIAGICEKPSISGDEEKYLKNLFDTTPNEHIKVNIITSLFQLKNCSETLFSFLEGVLESENDKPAVAALSACEKFNSKRLLAHLPVTAFSKNYELSFLALKVMKKHNPDFFARKTEEWLRDDRKESQEVAHRALLLLESSVARKLLLTKIGSSNNSASIEKCGDLLFLLSPDLLTQFAIEKMIRNASGTKQKDALVKLLTKMQDSSKGTGTEAPGSADSSDLLRAIRKISYTAKEVDFRAFDYSALIKQLYLPATALLCLIILYQLLAQPSVNDTASAKSTFTPRKIDKKQNTLLPGINSRISVTLHEYDVINYTWKATDRNNDELFIQFTGTKNLQAGQQLDIVVIEERKSVIGNVLVKARIAK